MGTSAFINNIRRDDYKVLEPAPLSSSEKRWDAVGLWIHEHPTIIKMIEIGLFLTGLAMMGALPFAPLGAAIALGIASTSLSAIGACTYFFLDLLVPPKHDMKAHIFSPGKCEGGELAYHGDIPILTLNTDDPYKAGFAHTYLLGKQLHQLIRRMHFGLHILLREPWTKDIPHVIEEMKKHIPQEYLLEMKGMAEGFNKWAKEHPLSFASPLSLEDIIFFHLIPESVYFKPRWAESLLKSREQEESPTVQRRVACTTIVDSISEEEGLGIARTMDWDAPGEYQLVVNRINKRKGIASASIGMPGFLGTTSAMNSEGLCLTMNVCVGEYHQFKQIQGLASSLLVTYALDNCKTVKEVEDLVNQHPPFGPFHLTAADNKNEAKAFHFYQGGKKYFETTTIREKTPNDPLLILNYRYPTNNTTECSLHCSTEREKLLHRFFSEANKNKELEKEKILEETLRLPYVNNWLSRHSLLMFPKSRKMKLSIGSAFSGKGPFVDVPTEKLFSL